MSAQAPSEVTPEQFDALCKQAQVLGFITQLAGGGKPTTTVVKEASGDQPAETQTVYSDLAPADLEKIASNYNNVWLPHRQEVTQGYYERLRPQAA